MSRYNPFKGITSAEIANTDITTFMGWNEKELRSAVRRLADTANKRIKEFEKRGINTPAFRSIMESGGKLSTQGKDYNELRSEFVRARDFLKAKSSTITGYKQIKEEFFNRVDATPEQRAVVTDDDLDKFWRAYEQTGAEVAKFVEGSPKTQKIIYDIYIENRSLNVDDLVRKIEDRFKPYYEQLKIIQDVGTSSYFPVKSKNE